VSETDIRALFDNLNRHSRNIREISVKGDYRSRAQAASCILKQCWPELQVLTLEGLTLGISPIQGSRTARESFIEFLGSHPYIKELRLPDTGGSRVLGATPDSFFLQLALNVLPRLNLFQGTRAPHVNMSPFRLLDYLYILIQVPLRSLPSCLT
jgi:hypothetical protein